MDTSSLLFFINLTSRDTRFQGRNKFLLQVKPRKTRVFYYIPCIYYTTFARVAITSIIQLHTAHF